MAPTLISLLLGTAFDMVYLPCNGCASHENIIIHAASGMAMRFQPLHVVENHAEMESTVFLLSVFFLSPFTSPSDCTALQSLCQKARNARVSPARYAIIHREISSVS